MLEGAENIILPIEIVTRFHLREICLEIETNGTAVVLVQKFVGDNVDTAGISVTREESVPNAQSMKSDIGAGGAGAMESFGIMTRGEDLPISKCDFVTGDARLVEAVERSRGVEVATKGTRSQTGTILSVLWWSS